MSVLDFKRNVNSQNGEDGVIEFIFNTMNIKNGNFIEFGAWDGKHLSNSYKLFNEGWGGIYIEGDKNKFNKLVQNFGQVEKITVVNSMVSFGDSNRLDDIIERSNHYSTEFDFVSIDVDGLDYFIFKDMNKYLPKVICIEVNSGHSPLYDKEIELNVAKRNIGQSLYVISKEAEKKGYFPLCYTGNLFLIKNEYKELFKDYVKSLEDIYFDFLNHIDNTLLRYLYKLFVVGKTYNGFYFENEHLKQFCLSKLNIQN